MLFALTESLSFDFHSTPMRLLTGNLQLQLTTARYHFHRDLIALTLNTLLHEVIQCV